MLLFCFRDHIEWNQISNNVKPGGNFVVLDLEPATWYNVRITAHNSAGFTVAEYEFATLTVTGGTFILYTKHENIRKRRNASCMNRMNVIGIQSKSLFHD